MLEGYPPRIRWMVVLVGVLFALNLTAFARLKLDEARPTCHREPVVTATIELKSKSTSETVWAAPLDVQCWNGYSTAESALTTICVRPHAAPHVAADALH